MNFLTLQNTLQEFELEIFTLNDVIKITAQSLRVVKSTLTRLVRQGKIFRLKKGYYSIRQIDDKFKFNKIYSNTYVGLYSALEYYQTTTQRFNNLDLITKHVLNKQSISDVNISFHKVNKKIFFGYEKKMIGRTSIFVSNIEKTLIDCIYFSSKVYLTEINTFIDKMKNDINKEKLIVYLKRIDSTTLNKRVGYLLENNGILLEGLKITDKYEKLNMNLSEKGDRNNKWKLILNEVL